MCFHASACAGGLPSLETLCSILPFRSRMILPLLLESTIRRSPGGAGLVYVRSITQEFLKVESRNCAVPRTAGRRRNTAVTPNPVRGLYKLDTVIDSDR